MFDTNTNFSELDSVFLSEKVFSSSFVHRGNEMESLASATR